MLLTSIRTIRSVNLNGVLRSSKYYNNVYGFRGSTCTSLYQERFFSALSKEEEEKEKNRVEGLTKYEKEIELRELDKQIAILNTKRGINTGELYTMSGKVKALARDYGAGYMVWYFTVWSSCACMIYSAITLGNVDAMAIIAKVDGYTGFDLSNKVDPTLGTIGVTLVANEILEPIRLPFVIMTTKPVVEFFYPKRY